MKKTFLFEIFLLVVLVASSVIAKDSSSGSLSLRLVNQDPDPAIAGDVVEVRIGITNIGASVVSGVLIELVQEYPFTLIDEKESVKKIETLKGYQGYYDSREQQIIKYKLRVNKDASEGKYELKLRYYKEGSSSSVQESLLIDVSGKKNAEVIHIDKTTLIPGRQSPLKFKINNVGSAPLKDMTFYWENSDNVILPVGSDNTRYIKYIGIGDSSEIEYQVIADTTATPGLYKLNLYLKYNDGAETQTTAGIYVGGTTDFDVAFQDSTSGQTSFTISNIGSNPANSVSVVIPQQRGWIISGTNSAIIGNLNKGDYTVVSFKLSPLSGQNFSMRRAPQTARNLDSEQMPSNSDSFNRALARQERVDTINQTANSLIIHILYTDTMGIRQKVEKEVSINPTAISSQSLGISTRATSSKESILSKYKWYIIGATATLIAFILYQRYKKNKRDSLLNGNSKKKQ